MRVLCLLFVLISISCHSQPSHGTPLLIVEQDRFGFIDSTGATVIPTRFQNAGYFSEGIAPARLNGYFGYIDATGEFVIEPQYDYAMEFKDGHAKVVRDGNSFFIDHQGKKLFDNSFPTLEDLVNSRAIVKTATQKFGIVNTDGKLIVDTIYKNITPTGYGTYIAEGMHHDPYNDKNKRYEIGILDSKGEFIVPFGKYTSIDYYKNGLAEVSIASRYEDASGESDVTGYIDTAGKLIFTWPGMKNGWIHGDHGEGMLELSWEVGGAHEGFIDLKGDIILKDRNYRTVYDFNNGRAVVEDKDEYYFIIDKKGQLVGRDTFSRVLNNGFNNNIAFVEKDGLWGAIDTNGNYLIKPKFSGIAENSIYIDCFFFTGPSDSNGNTLYGVADMQGNILIPARFSGFDHSGFQHGLLKVFENNRFGLVDKKGNYVWRAGEDPKDSIPLNIDYMTRSYYYASSPYRQDLDGPGGHGGSSNRSAPVPNGLSLKASAFEVIIDTTQKCRWAGHYEGIKVYVLNTSKDTMYFEASDSRLYMKMQAINKKGKWQDIEYLPSSWCGNSYHQVFLSSGEYWQFNAPIYHGEFSTKIRVQLLYKRSPTQRSKNNEVIYSNVIEGHINPGQFWRKQEYYPDGIMDPYLD